MRSKEEYSDDAIVQFHINDFFMAGLHCFLQLEQGWENFHSLLEVFFINRTDHGGPTEG